MWKNMVVPDMRRKDAICMPDNEGKNTDTLIASNIYCFITD